MLQFILSVREGDFNLYIVTLVQLIPWLFLLDHTHYARWLPVHVRDLRELPKRHPDVYEKLMEGKFVAQKISRKFSPIALDHAHEQLNVDLKGDWRIII